jgi:hypothetical protein
MNIPIIELKFGYCPKELNDVALLLVQRANLVYTINPENDTCDIIKNRYGVRGTFSLKMLREFKKCAIE